MKTVEANKSRITTQKSEINIVRSEIRHSTSQIIKQEAIIQEASKGFGQGAIIEQAKLRIQKISQQIQIAKRQVSKKIVQVKEFRQIVQAVKSPQVAMRAHAIKSKSLGRKIETKRVKILAMDMKISRMVQYVKSKRMIKRVMMFKRELFSANEVASKMIRMRAKISQ